MCKRYGVWLIKSFGLPPELAQRILDKKRGTVIAIDYVDLKCWMTGGWVLGEQDKSGFHFEIKIGLRIVGEEVPSIRMVSKRL